MFWPSTETKFSDRKHFSVVHYKVILSACSPVLRDLLIKQSALSPHSPFMPIMLYLRGISAKDLGHVLEFIYRGSVNLHQQELDDFLAVAKSLQIPLDEEENRPNPGMQSSLVRAAKVLKDLR